MIGCSSPPLPLPQPPLPQLRGEEGSEAQRDRGGLALDQGTNQTTGMADRHLNKNNIGIVLFVAVLTTQKPRIDVIFFA